MENNLELPHILKAKDVQTYLRISKGKVYELFKNEDFPAVKFDGSLRVFKEDFLNWVEQQRQKVN
ncbi:helix-turn-helix domain-containing protein [Bacillus cihuensis]|uniref:helix-turn-helix domain-containing protein n=1 Tax=Bacillus cihuensis TaxID=1208599 RepID=UPI000405443D|nr:helix-turn-helix domain-containing protein [Bacillus cihuensis]